MKRAVVFFAGLTAVLVQTLLLREMLAVAQGNELSIGLILSHWLLGSAAGSYGTYLLQKRSTLVPARDLCVTIAAICAWALLSLIFIRDLRVILGLFPGIGISLKNITLSAFLVFFPLGLLTGSQYGLAVAWYEDSPQPHPARTVYLLESAGYLIGGILFTYALLPLVNPVAQLLGLVIVSLWVIFAIASREALRVVTGICAVGCMALLPAAAGIDRLTTASLFPGYTVRETRNSPYSRLVIAERAGERFFFTDGIPFHAFPSTDIMRAEVAGHLPLLCHPQPRRVLVIGGGGSFLPEILQHPVEVLAYAELDPAMITLLQRYSPAFSRPIFSDPRIRIHAQDGRNFLARTTDPYDVMLIGIPYPVNLALNRYYTAEFYRLLRSRLAAGGIIAFSMPGSPVYIAPAMRELNAVALATLRTAFPHVRIVPGNENLFIASDQTLAAAGLMKRRFRERALRTLFLSPAALDDLFDTNRTAWLREQLAAFTAAGTAINRDQEPRGMLAALIYWQSVFASRATLAYRFVIQYVWLLLALPAGALLLGSGYGRTAATSGFAAMGLQMISLWGIQIAGGALYHYIGAVTGLFMAGLAFGSWMITAALPAPRVDRQLLVLELAMTALLLASWIAVRQLQGTVPLFAGMSAAAGLLLGMEFPLLVGGKTSVSTAAESSAAMRIYAADILGGWAAAVICGTLLIPAWGMGKTLLFLLAIKAVSVKWRVCP